MMNYFHHKRIYHVEKRLLDDKYFLFHLINDNEKQYRMSDVHSHQNDEDFFFFISCFDDEKNVSEVV